LDGTGTSAQFISPYGIAIDAAGNLYVSDYGAHSIRKITPAGVVSTVVKGATAMIFHPTGIAVDPSGTSIYVADESLRILKSTQDGVVSLLAGSGQQGFKDGPAAVAKFNFPDGIALDASGNIYVGDKFNQRIRKVTPSGVVSTLAGDGTKGTRDGIGPLAQFNLPTGVTVDASGSIYVTDTDNSRIRKIQ
jgi:DNA-binding beta-propeller fold protein YncE